MGRGLSEWTGPSVRRKRLCLFRREKLRPHARTRCPPEAANSHTVRPRSVFPDAQVAGENGFHFLRACGRELCEAFSTGPCFFFRFLLPRCDAAAPPWVFVLAPVHPRGSRRLSAFVTLRLFPTRGFLPPRTKPIRACALLGLLSSLQSIRATHDGSALTSGTQTPDYTGTPRPRPRHPAPPAAGTPLRPAACAQTSSGSRSRRSSRWP